MNMRPQMAKKSNASWGDWLRFLMKESTQLELKKAAITYLSGKLAAATNGFDINDVDFKRVQNCFDMKRQESLFFQGVTYIVKSVTSSQILAFNGRTYIIISRTNSMYIFVICQSRAMSGLAAGWVGRIADKLVEGKC
ncbi:hypothetical protein ScPMuIL_009733 [Solemya velum]